MTTSSCKSSLCVKRNSSVNKQEQQQRNSSPPKTGLGLSSIWRRTNICIMRKVFNYFKNYGRNEILLSKSSSEAPVSRRVTSNRPWGLFILLGLFQSSQPRCCRSSLQVVDSIGPDSAIPHDNLIAGAELREDPPTASNLQQTRCISISLA